MSRNYPNGYVYVFESGELVKIGKSHDPAERIKQVKGVSGRRVERKYISPLCSNYDAIEMELKTTFAKYRHLGEWFEVPFEEIEKEATKKHFEYPAPKSCDYCGLELFDDLCRQEVANEIGKRYPGIFDLVKRDGGGIFCVKGGENPYIKIRDMNIHLCVYAELRRLFPVEEVYEVSQCWV
jgi:hypothetical protein